MSVNESPLAAEASARAWLVEIDAQEWHKQEAGIHASLAALLERREIAARAAGIEEAAMACEGMGGWRDWTPVLKATGQMEGVSASSCAWAADVLAARIRKLVDAPEELK